MNKVFRYHLKDCEGYQHEGDTDTTESEQEIQYYSRSARETTINGLQDIQQQFVTETDTVNHPILVYIQ